MYLSQSSINTQNQTETSRSATKKKCSKSGGTKNESGDLRKEQLERTLGFLGAGGHVEISGILNFWPFGVEHGLKDTSMTSEPCMSTSFEESCELMEEQLEGKTVGTRSVSCFLLLFVCCCCCCCFFLNCAVLLCCLVLLVVVVFVFEAVLVDVAAAVVLPEGAIFLRQWGKSLF